MGTVQVGTATGAIQQLQNEESGEGFNPTTEEEIATQSLAAWRTAVSHAKKDPGETDGDWQKQRDKDESAAMQVLTDLQKKYPQSSTVYMMLGQVEEHFGKRKEAVGYFEQATTKSTISSISLFKLAENERQLGELEDSAGHYRQLLKAQPDFYPAKLGLAQCLLKKDPAQAQQLAHEVLAANPDPDSKKAAEAIVSESKGDNRRR